MKIYTKFGDAGLSALFDGSRVPKSHPRLETYGTLDELNSHLGLAIASTPHPELRSLLTELQQDLFTLSSDLATPPNAKNESKITRIQPADITTLESHIDRLTALIPELKRFILPGGGATASHLHVARTVARRAERCLVQLIAAEPQTSFSTPLIFLNRLSDLLFTAARYANFLDKIPDSEWTGKKTV